VKEIEDIILKARKFQEEAQKLLSKHEASPFQVNKIERTLGLLQGLTIKQKSLFFESLNCLKIVDFKLFRACHVLAWAGMIDYLLDWIDQYGFNLVSVSMGNLASKNMTKSLQRNQRMSSQEKQRRILEARQKAENEWAFASREDLVDKKADYAIIEVMRDCRFYAKPEMKSLHGLLSKRNECAHPTNYEPEFSETIGYVSELLNRIMKFEKKRV